ncbi:peptidoglycan DD-metalloendopeptidase family protein [Vibrio sp.]|nr:peptidoglycan DD-metalloendopeptidase family protein [Vibrio viridaestus]MDC0611949.1 peptidoglycan DD-metalloendopeptidase family protein [Vibrio sp.]
MPIVAIIAFWGTLNSETSRTVINIEVPEQEIVENIMTENQSETISHPDYEYHIRPGDSLSTIFSHLGFAYKDLMKVMETDLNYLALDTIKPGDVLRLWKTSDGTNTLEKLSLQLSLVESVEYTRLTDGTYEYKHVTIPGVWKPEALLGRVSGSFSQSAYDAGLNSNEIEQIVQLLKDKVNFSRDIRAGDNFEVVKSRQYVGDQLTGNSEIQAIKIETRGSTVSAYLYKDGQYYDEKGQSLQKAFRRYPTTQHWRVSSPFNPHRRHPVTGRLAPHNGTDFATPTGTSVLSTGDGVVEMIRHHPYAGNYVVIKHDNTYTTRYLHLSKILVHKGQRVTRGQKIALSGATGRVTGPHLHYELIVRGHPVNAMTAKIPMATSVPKNEMNQFLSRRKKMDSLIEQQELALKNHSGDTVTSG